MPVLGWPTNHNFTFLPQISFLQHQLVPLNWYCQLHIIRTIKKKFMCQGELDHGEFGKNLRLIAVAAVLEHCDHNQVHIVHT